MNKIINKLFPVTTFLLINILIIKIDDCYAKWVQCDDINAGTVLSITTFERNIFAGTDSGVYFSSNNGVNWFQKNQGFNNIPAVYALLIVNNIIFAGTSGFPVWRRELTDIIGN